MNLAKGIDEKKVFAILFLSFVMYAFITFYFDVRGFSWEKMNSFLILAVIPLVLGNYAIRLLRWKYYLKKIGVSLGSKLDMLIFFSGFSMIITPGKLGELIKTYLIKEKGKIPISRTAPLVFMERFGDIVGLSLLGLVSSFFYLQNPIILILVIIVLFIALAFIKNEKLVGYVFFKIFSKDHRVHKGYGEALKSLREVSGTGSLFVTIFLSMLSWFLECLSLWFILLSLGYPISIAAATFIFSFGTVAGAISMLPGGLGVSDGTILFLLVREMPQQIAGTATIMVRMLTLWLGVFVGFISLYIYRKNNQKL